MNDKIRIAHIVGKWLGGGVESVVMNYYRNINREKFEFDFICDSDSENIPYKEIEKLGGKVILVAPYQKIFSYNKELKEILQKGKYKIVHSHINTLSVFPLHIAKKVGVPIRIAHNHSTTNKKEWKKNIMKQILRPFSKVYATDYFACSEHAGRWLFGNKEFDNKNVYVLKNAIDTEKFAYNTNIRKRTRKELNINDKTIVIGHIGRFVAQKNHTFLIDIFNEIHKQNKNTLLLLVGQGPKVDEIKAKVDSLNLNSSVRFLGQRNDVDKLYQAFDVALIPSLYEGLCIVAIEAQASGLLCFLSTEVPKEANILKTTKYMELNDSPEKWAKTLLKNYSSYNRKNTVAEIENSGYNIKTEAIKLENKYIELLEKHNELLL